MFSLQIFAYILLLVLDGVRSEPQMFESTFTTNLGFGSTNGNVGIATTNRVGFLLRSNFEQCSSSVVHLGRTKIKVSPQPVGQCDTCCPLQIDRHIRFLLYTRSCAKQTVHGPAGPDSTSGDDVSNGEAFNNGGNDLRRRLYEAVPRSARSTRRARRKSEKEESVSDEKYRHFGYLSQSEPFGKLSDNCFNPNLKTAIFIHGFLEVVPDVSGNGIIHGYESRNESYNIIILDWSMLTTAPWYAQAIMNTRFTGKVLATFLEHYHSNKELSVNDVHLIGFSLGAHVAGIAGKFLRVKGHKVARITGLDPAFPGFQIKDRRSRLTYSDATYVDVIHTDASLLGFPVPIGHADFYPNYFNPPSQQQTQPGCHINMLLSTNSIDDIISCSHQRAWYLFSESMKNAASFPATRCRDWYSKNRQCDFAQDAVMGLGSTKENTPRGTYFLITHAQQPFSMTEGEQRQARNV